MKACIFIINKIWFLKELTCAIQKIRNSYITFLCLVISLILLISCNTDRNKRGYEYFPDMVYSDAYETYAPNPIFADGKTAQLPGKSVV